MNVAQRTLVIAVRVYQVTISPVLTCLFAPLGLGCRFHPTCSHYALEAVRRHGAIKGTMLAMRRLCRCHPWGGCGEDPDRSPLPAFVPPAWYSLAAHRAAALDRCADAEPHAYDLELATR